MNALKNRFWMNWVGVAMLGVASGGLMACGGDDEEEAPTVVVVITNQVTGVVVTNVAAPAATNNPAAPVAAGPSTAQVAGEWNGAFTSDEGTGHLDLDLLQTADAVTGQFFLTNGGPGQVGNATGTVAGDHLVVKLTVTGSPAWIDLDGHVNASSTAYTGNWSGSFGTGTFALQK